ncbi:TetR family transcriptional regulator [Kribbella sp. NBC_00382]|uniref:TetR/AcrR family transcriptional regulator n=1 Tax=Kribbella sp. NBC_00382 TaxID=2975967 RepID=UPI002E1F9551
MRDASSHAAAGISVPTIVGAALVVIRERGVEGLTMRSVAERLGVRAPTLYHHVRNKGELLELVARNAFDSFEADLVAYQQVGTLDEWIELTTVGSLRLRGFYAEHPGLARLIQSKATPDRDEGDGSRAALVRAQLEALVRLGVPEPTARKLFETSARWTLAAVAAEPLGSAGEDLFASGLEIFMAGLRGALQPVDGRAAGSRPSSS